MSNKNYVYTNYFFISVAKTYNMIKIWSFFTNPFLNCVKGSFKRAVKISTYTDAQLYSKRTDPFYGPLYTAYHPLHLLLLAAYNTWKAQGSVQIGSTFTIKELLQTLSSIKIGEWDLQIQAVYSKKTAPYIVLLPHGHKPYQSGTKQERINTVAQLKTNLTGIVPLSATETDVTAFHDELTAADIAQSGNVGNTKANSKLLITAIANAMVGLFSILGSCIAHFPIDPSVCSPIFDMATIRNQQQAVYMASLAKAAHAFIAERTFAIDGSIDAYNTGLVTIGYYLALNKGDGPTGYTVVPVLAGVTDTIDIASFINNTTNKFLCVVNLSTVAMASYKVDLG